MQTFNTIAKYCCIFSWLTYVPVRGPAYPVRAHLISSYRVASLIPCIEALTFSVSKFAQSAERLLNNVAPSIKFIDFKTEKLEVVSVQLNLDYPDSLGPNEIVRIIKGPDNRKYGNNEEQNRAKLMKLRKRHLIVKQRFYKSFGIQYRLHLHFYLLWKDWIACA